MIFNKLYLPFIGRVYCSQSVTLFQKEDVTWPDQKGCFTVSEELLYLHLPDVHAYADDTQLYLALKPGDYANETAVVSSMAILYP